MIRIRGWQIDGFGHFRDHRSNDLPDGITVFLGPNEAGKSTLLAFLRGMLFGFPTGRQAGNRFEPLHTRHMGGKLFLETSQGLYTIQRNGERKEGFKLYRPDDTMGSESELAALLGHADQRLFKSVFAFSLTELQDLNVHQEDGIKDRIFAGSLQGGRNTARAALNVLERQNASIFKPRGREVELVKLARELEAHQALIQEAKARALEYEDLMREETALDARIAGFTQEQAALQLRIAHEKTLLELWPRWLERMELQESLARLETVERVPEQAESRHAELVSTLKGLEDAYAELQLEHDDVAERLNALIPDERLFLVAERLAELSADVPRFLDWLQALAELTDQARQAEFELEAALTALGTGWSRERLEGFDASIPRLDEVSRWESRLSQAEITASEAKRELREAQGRLDASHSAKAGQAQRIAQHGEGPSLGALAGHEERLIRLRTLLLEQKDAQIELRQLEDRIRMLEIERERAPRPERRALPVPLRLTLAGLSALLLGLALWKGLGKDLVTALALAGTGLALGASSAQTIALGGDGEARRLVETQIQHAMRQLDSLRSRLSDSTDASRDAARSLGLSEAPSAAEVEAFAQRLGHAREHARQHDALHHERERLTHQVQEAEERWEVARQAEEAAREAQGALERAWGSWRQEAGIAEDRTPKGVAMLFQAHGVARQALLSLKACETQREAASERVQAFRQEAEALFSKLEMASPGTDTQLVQAIARLQERLAADQELRARQSGLRQDLASLALKREAKREAVDAASRALEALYAEAGAVDEAGFRLRLRVHAERQDVMRALRELDRMLDEQLGRDAQGESLRERLQAEEVASWRERLLAAELELEEIGKRRDDAHQVLGRLQEERRKREEASDVIARDHAYQAELDAFRRQARGWLVRGLAHDMIDEALHEAEKTRQPAVLAHASRLFAQVTEGRYVRLAQHEGGEIQVIDHRENRFGVEKLSRGTGEQLYLCLRLGLIREFARQSANLPLIMDDVFVNFDPERSRRVAELLVAFSDEHQVLLFTCHPGTANLLRDVQPDVKLVPMARYGQASASLAPEALPKGSEGQEEPPALAAGGGGAF